MSLGLFHFGKASPEIEFSFVQSHLFADSISRDINGTVGTDKNEQKQVFERSVSFCVGYEIKGNHIPPDDERSSKLNRGDRI